MIPPEHFLLVFLCFLYLFPSLCLSPNPLKLLITKNLTLFTNLPKCGIILIVYTVRLGRDIKLELTSEEKLFALHRSIAYALKESSIGEDYTYPIRLTAVILNDKGKPVFQHIHFSFPCCWKLEGKINSFKL